MVHRALFLLVLIPLGACTNDGDRCTTPPSGYYRVQWLEVPADCPFLAETGWVYVTISPYGPCLPWTVEDGTCGLKATPHGPGCAYAIAHGRAYLDAERLVSIGDRRYRGEASAWVSDLPPGGTDDYGPSGRRCAATGVVELRFDADYTPAPWIAGSPFCDEDAGADACPDGLTCRDLPGLPWSACGPTRPEPPAEGDTCLASCAAGTACQYAPRDVHDGTGHCLSLPAPGAPCADLVDAQARERCAPGAHCDVEGTCRAHPSLGQPCEIDIENCPSEPCVDCAFRACCAEGYCAPDETGSSVCLPRKQRGEACERSPTAVQRVECVTNASCECADAACAGGVCVERRFLGERCDEPDVACSAPQVCREGTCRSP